MVNENPIANLTQHQNITDALLNTMGECMAVQQALLHIPPYDGKNLPLRTFLQDVENGLAICPEGIQNAFFKGVVAKLRDTARDAVSGIEINSIDALRNALREYFAPKKTYSHYCGEIQAVRMRKGESVMEYYTRIKRIMEGAKASLKDTFTNEQVPHMETMLEGIALESFKRGLSDNLLYAVSVKEPETLDAAVKIARRIERDMSNYQDGRGALNVIETFPTNSYMSKQVMFRDDQRRSPSPWRNQSPIRESEERGNYGAPRRSNNFDRNMQTRGRSPAREQQGAQSDYRRQQDYYRSQSPYRYTSPVAYPYMPPMGYPYYMPPPFYPPPQQLYSPSNYSNITTRAEKNRENLNSQGPRRMDATTGEQSNARPPTVKFMSVEDMTMMKLPEKESPQ